MSSIQNPTPENDRAEWPHVPQINFAVDPASSDIKSELLNDRDSLDLESLDNRPSTAVSNAPELKTVMWVVVNVISTILIIFVNKSIFSTESLRNCPMLFTSYHFFVTSVTLWIMSRPFCGGFVAKPLSISRTLLPAGLMCLQIVFQNISLAYSSVIFHQLVRLLLTPVTALSNFMLYRSTIPTASVPPLAITCIGVGIVLFYDTRSQANDSKMTTPTGVFAALVGLCSSAIYTTLVGSYHKKFEVTSMQLLLNQAALGTGLLICFAPMFDTLPVLDAIPKSLYGSVLLSGVCAFLVNLSQFYVIDATGPVSSTVIGHLKSAMVVSLGWILNNQAISKQSIAGICIALTGMILYMMVVLRSKIK